MVEDQKDKSQIIANSFFKALDFTGGPEKAAGPILDGLRRICLQILHKRIAKRSFLSEGDF